MTKNLFVIAIIIFFSGVLSGCTREYDRIAINNKGKSIFDDINIKIKDGYFYDRHEKFTVDENTVAVTIFFVNENGDEWMAK